MATRLPPQPPLDKTFFAADGETLAEWWQRFMIAISKLSGTSAPIDAQYIVATTDGTLTNEVNLGALASGYLKIVVALGVAVVSSHATVPTNELSGTLQAAQEPAHTGDVTNAAGSLILSVVNLGAISGAALLNLTGSRVNHGTKSITFADTPYTVAATDEVILVDASGGAVTVNLAAPNSGRVQTVKKTDASANAVTLNPAGGATIDGAASASLPAQWNCLMVDSNGANYFVIAQV